MGQSQVYTGTQNCRCVQSVQNVFLGGGFPSQLCQSSAAQSHLSGDASTALRCFPSALWSHLSNLFFLILWTWPDWDLGSSNLLCTRRLILFLSAEDGKNLDTHLGFDVEDSRAANQLSSSLTFGVYHM